MSGQGKYGHWFRILMVVIPLVVVVVLPIALRKGNDARPSEDVLRLDIVTPHNESIQREFSEAFNRYYQEKTGREVYINWLMPGGTSEIRRVLDTKFKTAEKNGREGVGIDLFFGGGPYDFTQQAKDGRFAKLRLFETQPELFSGEVPIIPQSLGGEPYYSEGHDWIGACLSSFGIMYNRDGIARLGVPEPKSWADLTDPRYFGTLALADPTKSGSVAKIFEMMIQEAIQEQIALGMTEEAAVRQGWYEGVNRIRMIAANGRYFADSSGKVPRDVTSGNAVAGMCIDYYGRTFEDTVRGEDGESRVRFVVPVGGTSVSVDPVAVLRGAPHGELAQDFVEFLISTEGQQLWAYVKGSEGGPRYRNLRRLPVRRDFYTPENEERMVDGNVKPYELAQSFQYEGCWTEKYFTPLRVLVRVMCINLHEELKTAWLAQKGNEKGVQETGSSALFELGPENDWPSASYDAVGEFIRPTLKSEDAVEKVRMQRELEQFFREEYKRASR